MPYNATPEWTEDIRLPQPHQLACPECGLTPPDAMDKLRELLEYGPYWAAHVPPELILTCDNPECLECDIDYRLRLRLVIEVKRRDE